jgi:hypothetical protein
VTLGIWTARSVGPLGIVFCLPFVLVATLLVLPELVRPFTWIIDHLFGTGPGSGDRPPLDLRLARAYVEQERYADALEEYRRVQGWHPAVSEPYEQIMILLARSGSGRRSDVERVYRQGRRHLRSREARADLDRARKEALGWLDAGAK